MTSSTNASSRAEESVGDRARRVIHASGLSQREFAARIGLDATALSKALRGARRFSERELVAIADLGRVSSRYLLRSDVAVPSRLRRAEALPSRPRADPLDGESRRRQIISAAAHLIADRGLHNVRVADIARVCETSPSTLHYHFAGKDEALIAALSFYAERLHVELEDRFAASRDPREKLRCLIEVQLPQSEDDIDEWSVWIQAWNEALFRPELRSAQLKTYRRWRDTVIDLLAECAAAGFVHGGDLEMLATRFTALIDGLAIQLLASTSDMTVDRMRRVLLDAFEPALTLRERD